MHKLLEQYLPPKCFHCYEDIHEDEPYFEVQVVNSVNERGIRSILREKNKYCMHCIYQGCMATDML